MFKKVDTSIQKKPSGGKPWKVLSALKKIKDPKRKSFTNHELKRILDEKYLKVATVPQIKEDIKSYNKIYNWTLKWSEFNLLWQKDNCLITADNKWNLELFEITKINSRSVLNYIKENDSNWEFDSYDIRNELMHLDDSVKSFEAFTKWEIPKEKYEAKDYLKNSENWLDKRVELHNQLFDKYHTEAIQMSDRIGSWSPRVICMKWNTAVGKTYTLRHIKYDILKKYPLLDEEWQPSWALNPDLLKSAIRNYDRSWSIEIVDKKMKHTISDCQSHIEGWIVNDRIIRKLFEEKKSIVLDKRFVDEQSIQKTVTNRMWDDYKLTIIDIWWDLKDSLERAYRRDVLSNKPIVPYEQIEDWYIKTTTNRDKIARMKQCDEYFLFYKWKLIAQAMNWDLVRHDYYTYDNLVRIKAQEDLKNLRSEFKEKINNKVKNWK